jgi:hypothetical protein
MLKNLDVKKEIQSIISSLKSSKGKKRDDLFKRLKIFVAFHTS